MLARQLAQDQDWVALKTCMDTMRETYLRETMEGLIQFASPRLYHDYWTVCPTPVEEDDEDAPLPPPNDNPAFAKTGAGS